uniref:ATPase subunit 8 n=1 Tax=Hyalopeplus sp. TaxID=2931294 RepID=A0A8T9ZY11_9HEMI|nr:ATPase subunit 8 [Hyalopeplus sp.]
MPQMAPIWWTTLYAMFIMSYMTYVMIMYFFISYGSKNEMKKSSKKNNMNWKW